MGGVINKKVGCVGDMFIVGVGCFVNNVVVVLCMGMGEMFMCVVVVYDVVVQMEYVGKLLVDVIDDVVMCKLMVINGCGGLIVVDVQGNVVLLFNIEGMYCGFVCGV